MNSHPNQVVVLDDDSSVLLSLERLLQANGYEVHTHLTPESFFSAGLPAGPACLLLDQHLGTGKGTDVHAEMQRRGWAMPTLFLTADWDTHTVVQAVRGGADDYLTKPYDPVELLQAVSRSLEHAHINWQANDAALRARTAAMTLTARERNIIKLVVSGMLNKQIAAQLGIALVTVKVHRGRAMQKLGAKNPAELARIAALAGIAE